VSVQARRTAMAGIVALVLFWPLAHMGLVAQAHIDPWEFFGWAMYSKPATRVQVRVEVERGGEVKPLRAMGEMRRRVRDFARARTALGSFASPTDLLAAIFESDGTIETVGIVLRDIRLDLDSAILVGVEERLRFDRPLSSD
jgi:hypothetical protein